MLYPYTFTLHSLSDTEIPVTDALQQAETRDCKRVPNHNDASQTHKVSVSSQSHMCCYVMFYFYHQCCIAVFPHQGRKTSTAEPQAADCSGNSAGECD